MPTVADVLKECCDNANVRFKAVRKDHGDCKQLVYGTGGPGGICCALSLLWLSRYFKGDMENDQFGGDSFGDLVMLLEDQPGLILAVQNLFGSLLSNAPPVVTKGQKLADQLRDIQDREVTVRHVANRQGNAVLRDGSISEDDRLEVFHSIMKATGFKDLYKRSMASLGVANVKFIETHSTNSSYFCFQDRLRPYQSAINFMTGQSGATLIKFSEHYVAVISDIKRPKYKFLDVNGGQAISADQTAFKDFLKLYFQGAVIDEYTKSGVKTIFLTTAVING